MNDLITTTRATVKRGWTEFEPKVIAGLLSGSTGAAIVSVLISVGFHVDDTMRNFIIVGCYFLGSYITPSSGMVITTKSGTGMVETKTTGHTVTTATNSIPVMSVAAGAPGTIGRTEARQAPDVPLSSLLRSGPSDDQATQVLPPSRFGDN